MVRAAKVINAAGSAFQSDSPIHRPAQKRKLKNTFILLPVSLMLVSLVCRSQTGPASIPVITNSQGHFAVVYFPKRWVEPGPRNHLIATPKGEIRELPNAKGGELLFAAKSLEVFGSYSDNHYSISLNSTFRVRAIPARTWNRAHKVSTELEPFFPTSEKEGAPSEYEYAGKKYVETGKSGGDAALSPDHKFLAIMSYTDAYPPFRIFSPIGGGEAMRGDAFWEIYDTKTGEKVLSGQMSYSGQSAGIMFSNALWVDSRYFVLPLNDQFKTILLGVLPRQ